MSPPEANCLILGCKPVGLLPPWCHVSPFKDPGFTGELEAQPAFLIYQYLCSSVRPSGIVSRETNPRVGFLGTLVNVAPCFIPLCCLIVSDVYFIFL